jgi:hypothetical protein
MVMEGMAMPQMDMPVMKMTADVGVTGVAANGDVTYDVAFTAMTAEAQPGMDPRWPRWRRARRTASRRSRAP